jgi:PIN domain nuclease of toxin-antitoxin system
LILLDTHIWLWLANDPDRLTPAEQQVLTLPNTPLAVSAISLWEIAQAVGKGRIRLSLPVREWEEETIASFGIAVLPITPQVATTAADLPGGFHGDPADRLIVATAIVHRIPLATHDDKIQAYPHVFLIR